MCELPPPPVPDHCDCRDLDGFMLNVERLMASEFVALSSHEVVAAALFLWCRAWKQTPAASLPDDDRVLAAFARLPAARFQKLRKEVMRGFVKCSDGRLYHQVLADEAVVAYERKVAFRKRREADADRLRNWRAKGPRRGTEAAAFETHAETADEMPNETRFETGFVAEGQGQGQGQEEDKDLCPKPDKPVRTRQGYPADFERFWSAYPTDKLMSKQEAAKVWSKLTEDDRASAIAAIPGFVAHCRQNPTYRPVHANRFLGQRRFDGFILQQKPPGSAPREDDPRIEFGGGWSSLLSNAVQAHRTGKWNRDNWGPTPGTPGCRVHERYWPAFGITPPTRHVQEDAA